MHCTLLNVRLFLISTYFKQLQTFLPVLQWRVLFNEKNPYYINSRGIYSSSFRLQGLFTSFALWEAWGQHLLLLWLNCLFKIQRKCAPVPGGIMTGLWFSQWRKSRVSVWNRAPQSLFCMSASCLLSLFSDVCWEISLLSHLLSFLPKLSYFLFHSPSLF